MSLEVYECRRGSEHGFEGRVECRRLPRAVAVAAVAAVASLKGWIGREEADSVVRAG